MAQQTSGTGGSAVPDAPAPTAAAPLSGMKGQIAPGMGMPALPNPDDQKPATPAKAPAPAPAAQAPASSGSGLDSVQKAPPEQPAPGQGNQAVVTTLRTYTNFVIVPVTVKDNKGNLVAGLTFRDFQVFENGQRQALRLFTVDPAPLSIAFVIDQSLTQDVMAKVNNSLGAIQGALTPYDEVAVFTYNNGAQESTGFTGAQSHRLEAVLALTKATGRDESMPVNSGPLAGCSISANGNCSDPNLQVGRSAGGTQFMTLPKEIHTLNDAILMAAESLSRRPPGRRRLVYVVSDGKEYGSKATTKEVIKFLQTNQIAVYATLVGDSARWGEGYLSRFHLPFQMNDNILLKYAQATGGSLDSERSVNGIEKSYMHIAEEARTQYTLGYLSHEPIIDGRYRSIEVRVDRPSVDVTAKPGYYPTAQYFR